MDKYWRALARPSSVNSRPTWNCGAAGNHHVLGGLVRKECLKSKSYCALLEFNINTKHCQVLIASFFSVHGKFPGCVVVAFQASILWNLNGRAFGHTAQKFFPFFLQVTSFLDFLLFARPPWQIQRQHRSNVCRSWPWQNHLTIGASYCRLALNHRSLFEA